ncbi:MAG TPA: sigma-70 family RNA polymerase sigma factor [Polyangiales bacterium]|nr:sigma-70 family RNA polymerase sigma factor [Polyangiales bacterium]
MMEQSDASLLSRWGAGDPGAGDELIRRHFAALHGFLRARVASEVELEDLVQHTLLACVEARHRYRAQASFRSFLLAIARNRLYMHYQRARSAPMQIVTTVRDPASSPTLRRVHAEELERLECAVAELPPPMRHVLELSYWHELDASAIAQRLGMPLNTAYSRLRRAKLALRAALEPRSMR